MDPSIFKDIILTDCTVKEALDILEGSASSDSEDERIIFISPPDPAVLTDEDSADEDEGGMINNLTSHQLLADAEVRSKRKKILKESFDELSQKNRKRSWVHGDMTNTIDVSGFSKFNYDAYKEKSPVEIFEFFFNEEVIELVVTESRKYALFGGFPDPLISAEELKCFLGILMLSGYCVLPGKRFYWDSVDDVNNKMVSDAMRRNRFITIMKFFHVADNTQLDMTDKFCKLRPLMNLLKKNFLKHFVPSPNLSYDESMIEYFGKHPCKQCIRNKPIRFGYKVWTLSTQEGYLVNFDVYQGKSLKLNSKYDQLFGKASAPLVSMIDELPEYKENLPYTFYFDNLFTSFNLLTHLKSLGYWGTGTIRDNRIPKSCPLTTWKEMKKNNERGSTDYIIEKTDGIFLARWKDNSVVTMASTCHGFRPKNVVRRYSQADKKIINVDQPNIIKNYNHYMGGVDRMNQDINTYRVHIRSKKYYWPIFTWFLDVAINNSWNIYKMTGRKMTKIMFRRAIVQSYLIKYETEKSCSGPSASRLSVIQPGRRNDDIRYDRLDHFVEPIEKKRRCAFKLCKSIIRTRCSKCDVGICIPHFAKYHKK